MDVKGISCDSRSTREGDLFVAITGTSCDGHSFLEAAIANGAKAILLEKDVSTKQATNKIIVKDARVALSKLASRWYGHPSSRTKVIGITGTNGKSTTCYLVDGILSGGGFNCGLVGTVGYKVKDRVTPSGITTPGPIDLQQLLNEMVIGGADYAIIEVSSHSLDQHRVDDISFDVAIFTNLTLDHLDYHQTLDRYFEAKMRLFEGLTPNDLAVINFDDPYGKRLIPRTKARVMTYGMDRAADVRAQIKGFSLQSSQFRIQMPVGEIDVTTKLIGRHNVYNALGAACVGISEGISLDRVAKALESSFGAPGRLERIVCGQPFDVFVDYAHTDDALSNVLSALRGLAKGRIILVFGCGGDRDRSKRPLMGEVAQQYSDYVILTSDNPRSEDPIDIVRDIERGMQAGLGNYAVILDRYQAIQEALAIAREGDIVLIAGKGHESFQVFKNKKVPFDDRLVVREILKENLKLRV